MSQADHFGPKVGGQMNRVSSRGSRAIMTALQIVFFAITVTTQPNC